jgi:hypothetical protein
VKDAIKRTRRQAINCKKICVKETCDKEKLPHAQRTQNTAKEKTQLKNKQNV